MKKSILITIIIVITSAFCIFAKTSSANFTHGQDNELLEFVNELNVARPSLVQPDDYLDLVKKKMVFPKSYYKAISSKEATALMTRRTKKQTVTIDEACSDVDLFFRMLKYMMGRYDILGGEFVFDKAKEKIINEIKSSKNKNISTDNLETIMVRNLDFITDNHFMIGNHQVFYENQSDNMKYQTFMSGLYFKKDSKGYCLIDNRWNNNYYVSCNNKNVSMVPYLNDNGEILYTLVQYIMPKVKTNTDTIILTQGPLTVNWEKVEETAIKHRELYKEYDNIAYIDLININDEETENKLTEIGKKAKQKDAVIVDLRYNGGIHCYNFMNTFLGPNENVAEVAYERKTMLSDSTVKYGKEHETFTEVANCGSISDNDTLVIVLVDNKTACASEDFALHFRFANNTIIVGTNTLGHLDGGFYGVTDNHFDDSKYDIVFKYLPNSGIVVRVDNAVSYYGNYEDMVGKGFLPDLYVSDTGAELIPVVKMLIKNNVITEETGNALLQDRLGVSVSEYATSNNNNTSFKCECGNTAFTFKQPDYICTACGKSTDHEKMMDAVNGIWKWKIGDKDFTLLMGEYSSSNKVMYCDGKPFQSSSAGNWYLESDYYACLEFIAFKNDKNVIFFKTIDKDKIICDFVWDGARYEDITITRFN